MYQPFTIQTEVGLCSNDRHRHASEDSDVRLRQHMRRSVPLFARRRLQDLHHRTPTAEPATAAAPLGFCSNTGICSVSGDPCVTAAPGATKEQEDALNLAQCSDQGGVLHLRAERSWRAALHTTCRIAHELPALLSPGDTPLQVNSCNFNPGFPWITWDSTQTASGTGNSAFPIDANKRHRDDHLPAGTNNFSFNYRNEPLRAHHRRSSTAEPLTATRATLGFAYSSLPTDRDPSYRGSRCTVDRLGTQCQRRFRLLQRLLPAGRCSAATIGRSAPTATRALRSRRRASSPRTDPTKPLTAGVEPTATRSRRCCASTRRRHPGAHPGGRAHQPAQLHGPRPQAGRWSPRTSTPAGATAR